jgi:hypothetical protein
MSKVNSRQVDPGKYYRLLSYDGQILTRQFMAVRVYSEFSTDFEVGLFTFVAGELKQLFNNVYLVNGFPKYTVYTNRANIDNVKGMKFSLKLNANYTKVISPTMAKLERSIFKEVFMDVDTVSNQVFLSTGNRDNARFTMKPVSISDYEKIVETIISLMVN